MGSSPAGTAYTVEKPNEADVPRLAFFVFNFIMYKTLTNLHFKVVLIFFKLYRLILPALR